ncbi:hypothetical protein ACWC09_23640 [Streptomyces sp. NPDC001617]
MDTENPSAPQRAQSRVAAKNHPIRDPETGGGLIHDHTRHTSRFTVIGNHLIQHPSWVLIWAKEIEIARRPDLSARYAQAEGNLEHEDSAIAQEALRELSAVLEEALKAVRE